MKCYTTSTEIIFEEKGILLMGIVKNIMNKDFYYLPSTASIGDAIRLMGEKKIGGLPIVNENRVPIAYLSDGDIISYVTKNVEKRNSKFLNIRGWYELDCFTQYINHVVDDSVMSCATQRIYTVDSNVRNRDAATFMNKKHLKIVPVVEGGKLVGILSQGAMIQSLFERYIANPDAECITEPSSDFNLK